MPNLEKPIANFWEAFRAHAAALAVAESADNPVYDDLLEELQKVDPGLYLEFCAAPGACELIVTADGERSLFPIAREVVAAAPKVEGWTIRALKPRLGFPETATWENLTLAVDDIVFDPLEREGSPELGLRVFVPGIGEAEVGTAHNAILRAMDHGLGEERLARTVEFVEVRPLTADVEPRDLIPLSDLEAFIDFRERRRNEAG
jgi:hypothetical protein